MKYFKLFANCILVKGVKRSLIMDLQMHRSELLPNDLFTIITEIKGNSVKEFLEKYSVENQNTIMGYIDYLIDNNFGFICDYNELDKFPELNINFLYPKKVSNVIVEYNNLNDFNRIIKELGNFNCNAIHIISYVVLSEFELVEILKATNNTILTSIEFSLIYNYSYNSKFMRNISNNFDKITFITFYNSPSKRVYSSKLKLLFKLETIETNLISFKCCGNVNLRNFSTNKNKVLESINHNSCLNRKISIDVNGEIRNCPAMSQSFGNIKDTTLEEALNHKDFKKYWNITKDMIDVCKDCEFRYICTDCRAYLEKPEDIYSKPLKCGYNPYTNEWSEWSTNPLKQKAIEFYGMQELVKKDNEV